MQVLPEARNLAQLAADAASFFTEESFDADAVIIKVSSMPVSAGKAVRLWKQALTINSCHSKDLSNADAPPISQLSSTCLFSSLMLPMEETCNVHAVIGEQQASCPWAQMPRNTKQTSFLRTQRACRYVPS